MEDLHQQSEELADVREALDSERLRYQELFEFAPDGYLVTDAEGTIRQANRAAAHLLGSSARLLPGKPLLLFVAEEDRKNFQSELGRLKGADRTREWEVCLQPREGRAFRAALTVAAVRAPEGEPVTLRWLVRDISARREAEEQVWKLNVELEQRVAERTAELEAANSVKDAALARERAAREEAEAANRAKDEFLAMVSHELRTPLNAMSGWMYLLRAGKLDESKTAHALDIIHQNIKALTQLIDDLLDVSRIVAGKLQLKVRPIELAPVVEAAMDTVRPAAAAKTINLHKEFDAAVDRVMGDPDRLQQVVWNLLSNAIKFTPSGGQVTVRLQRGTDAFGSHVEIMVQDAGKGISPEFLPYVFDRFRQDQTVATRKHGGLGLGLAIVRHLVELHGGTVEAASPAASPGEGQGATFTVRLPLVEASVRSGVVRATERAAVPKETG